MKESFKVLVEKILIWEAKAVLKKYKPKVAAITGTVGKTTTKDAVYAVLSSVYKTRKSEKSYNNRIGIALTILGCASGFSNPFIWMKNVVEGFLHIILPYKYPEWLVLEVAAGEPGDIESVAYWIRPDVTVITRFADVPVHVEFFPSIDDLIREKGYLAQELKPEGVFVFNHDDNRVRNFSENIKRTKITFGFEPGADVSGADEFLMYGKYENSDLEFPTGISFSIHYNQVWHPIAFIGAIGKQHIYPILAAFAVGISQKLSPEQIQVALKSYTSPNGRMKLIPGIKDTLIIDDSYNSSPVAVEAALKTLDFAQVAGRKIAVLGDMMELGTYSIEEHKRVGEIASQIVDILITVGIRSRATADAALDAQMDENAILQFESSEEAGKYVESLLKPGDLILIKGSQTARMERAVKEIMRHPEESEKLLVRQEPSWLERK